MTGVDPAVEALARLLIEHRDRDYAASVYKFTPYRMARDVLDAIARNEVPGVTLAANRERACCTCVIGVCSEEGECCESHDCPGTLAADREPDGLRAAIEALADEWSSMPGGAFSAIRCRRVQALREALAAHPATDQPEVRR